MALVVFVFSFTSFFGNYSYSEVNLNFLGVHGRGPDATWVAVLVSIFIGSVAALEVVWALTDVAMGAMAVINPVAIVLLTKWAVGC